MSVNFGELIRSKKIKFNVTPHSTFSSDLHIENFFGYLFNTSKKHINDKSSINAYYKPGTETLFLKDEAIDYNVNKRSLSEILDCGFENVENIIIYHNVLEYCMLNSIDTKIKILQILKEFADFAIYALELEAFICAYHFNQEEPHLHIVYKAKTKKKIEKKPNEDEDL